MTITEPSKLDAPQEMMEFFAHIGIPIADEISEQVVEDANAVLAHFGIDNVEIVMIGPDGLPIDGPYREDQGVKGMKWGVRKRAVASAGSTGPKSPRPTTGPARKPARRSSKTMTNEELNTVINRLRLESQYNQMTASKGDQARQFIKDTLLSAGKSTVQTYANQYLNAAVGTVLNKAGVPSAASITQAAQKAAEEARKAAQAAT